MITETPAHPPAGHAEDLVTTLRGKIDDTGCGDRGLVAERAQLSRRIQTARMNAGGTRVELGRERVIRAGTATRSARTAPSSPMPCCRSAAAPLSGTARMQSMRRSAAQRVSWWRLDSCSLRSTFDACVSTVLIEMNSSARDLLVGVAAGQQPQHLALARRQLVELGVDRRRDRARRGTRRARTRPAAG